MRKFHRVLIQANAIPVRNYFAHTVGHFTFKKHMPCSLKGGSFITLISAGKVASNICRHSSLVEAGNRTGTASAALRFWTAYVLNHEWENVFLIKPVLGKV